VARSWGAFASRHCDGHDADVEWKDHNGRQPDGDTGSDVDRHDLVVIGAGSAGLVAATTAAWLGARVALIESERVGGDCTWTGCVPSKALIRTSQVTQQARSSPWTKLAEVDYPLAAEHVHRAVEAVYEHEAPARLAKLGIDMIEGPAEFRDAGTVQVGGRALAARRVVVCTGAAPVPPPIQGLADVDYLTYRTVFGLESLPERLIVLGGGPVGAELAQALARLGSSVTLVEQAPRLLPVADPDASKSLAEAFRADNVELVLGLSADRVHSVGRSVAVEAGGQLMKADAVLVAIGRQPWTAGLGLERAGVTQEHGAIRVDSRLRTKAAGIFAAGDVTGGLQFTHYAGWQGYAAARNALFPGSVRGIRTGIPWTVFTDPAVGQVGATFEQARKSNRAATCRRIDLDYVDRAQTDGTTNGFIKLVMDRAGKLLGATVVSPNAGELINELSVAIEAGATVGDLARSIHVYPTYGFAIQDLAGRISMGRATSGWKGRLLARLARR
jgi:pyruvate/2-oxoglutarate dehydrogenase complex dihydrolipoamide dehydrogenase (E3) component